MSVDDERIASQLLLLEYERSSQLCNHVDGLRNVITSFFLTLVAGAAVAVSRYADGSLPGSRLGTSEQVVAAVCAGAVVVGALFVCTLARLRRVQLERYRLMNGILDAALTGPARGLVPFGSTTIVLPGRPGTGRRLGARSTGSYLWTLVIILPTAALSAVVLLVLVAPDRAPMPWRGGLAIVITAVAIALLDRAYQTLSAPPAEPIASDPTAEGDQP